MIRTYGFAEGGLLNHSYMHGACGSTSTQYAVEGKFSEVRGELIWQAVLFWAFHGNDLRLRNYQRTLVAYIIEEDNLLGGSNKLKVWLSYLSCGA